MTDWPSLAAPACAWGRPLVCTFLFFCARSSTVHHVDLLIRMDMAVFDCFSNVDKEDFNLFPCPSESEAEQLIRPAWKTLYDVLFPVSPQVFQKWILWPGVEWHLLDAHVYINIAGLTHPRGDFVCYLQRSWLRNKLCSFSSVLYALYEWPVRWHGAIVTEWTYVYFMAFEPSSATFEMALRSCDQIVEGLKRPEQVGYMYKIVG